MKKPWKPKLERTERVNEKPNLFATAGAVMVLVPEAVHRRA